MELWGNVNFVVTEHLQEHLTQRVMRCELRCLQLACVQPCHLGPRALRTVSRHAGVTAGSSSWHSACPHLSVPYSTPPPCDPVYTPGTVKDSLCPEHYASCSSLFFSLTPISKKHTCPSFKPVLASPQNLLGACWLDMFSPFLVQG